MTIDPAKPRARRASATAFLLIVALWVGPTPTIAAPQPSDPRQNDPRQNDPQEENRDRAASQRPVQVEEEITVTATRLPLSLSDITASAVIIPASELRARPALGLDEALRWQPQFSLFRRSPARSAHPTSQGVNLRGVSPSGTSRALVLVDGAPLTDPFGGWVYWDRVPRLALERVEMAFGGGSAPFGNQALSGVLQLVTRSAGSGGPQATVEIGGGSQETLQAGTALGLAGDRGAALLSAQIFHTGGYFAVEDARRGAVDREVASRHQSARLRFDPTAALSISLDVLHETRDNGTVEQTNGTIAYGVAARWSGVGAGVPRGWQANAFARRQRFRSRFSSVASDRDSEVAVLDQRVPATDLGVGGFGWHDIAGAGTLTLGGDWRRVSGRSEEDVLLAGFSREPGGTQNLGGGYATAQWRPAARWGLDVSLRVDAWHNSPDADSPSRSDASISPRAGIVFWPDDEWSLRASAYRAFRAPTLNELYRQFRVGNVSTAANADLEEEVLTGAEVGVRWQTDVGPDSRIGFTATAYVNDLDNAVINATLSAVPGELVRRQRRNLGQATARGLEVESFLEIRSQWRVGLSLAALGSRIDAEPVSTGEAMTNVVGNRLPQVPDYRLRGSVSYLAEAGWRLLGAVHAVGEQFEDDRNRLPLAAGTTVDAAFEWPLRPGVIVGAQIQNLFDERLEVGRTPITTLGAPRSALLSFLVDLDRIGR